MEHTEALQVVFETVVTPERIVLWTALGSPQNAYAEALTLNVMVLG